MTDWINQTVAFDTDLFFAGGAGILIEYHDAVKPVYLVALIKALMKPESSIVPVEPIRKLTMGSIVEWYLNRRYRNPFKCLDYEHRYDDDTLDTFLRDILSSDDSVYRMAPLLQIGSLLSPYKRQHMSFPVTVYSPTLEPGIASDYQSLFPGIPTNYLHGDISTVIGSLKQNYTYMVSDVSLFNRLSEALDGTCSHLIVSSDYGYNRNRKKGELMTDGKKYSMIRLQSGSMVDPLSLALGIASLGKSKKGDD